MKSLEYVKEHIDEFEGCSFLDSRFTKRFLDFVPVEEWEKFGVARYVTWPRTVCSIEGHDINGKPLKGDYVTSDKNTFPMAEGFNANVKYIKCDWIPRQPENQSLTELLFEHLKEMIEIEKHTEIDGKNYILLLSEEQADELEKNWNDYTCLREIYISKFVLLTTKQNELFYSKPVHIIPNQYFNAEMREAGEAW